MNKLWHEKNLMPHKPTLEQKVRWHGEHMKHCACRKPPKAIAQILSEK